MASEVRGEQWYLFNGTENFWAPEFRSVPPMKVPVCHVTAFRTMLGARDAAVGAIVTAAGGLAVGLVKLTASGWLSSIPAFGMKGWQLLTAGAFAVNVVSVAVPGRVDGEMAAEAKRAMAAKIAAKITDAANDPTEPAGIPRVHWSRGLVSPAGWAFAIWGPIFLGESALTAMAAAPGLTASNPVASGMLASAAPWFAGVCGLQSLWCAAFRPWAKRVQHFWLPAALLSAEAAALSGAHGALIASSASKPMTIATYVCVHLPVAMHFGWITAAAVVSANSFAQVARWAPSTKLSFAFVSVWLAVATAAGVSITTGDPVIALTVAWALSAVAADGGKSDTNEFGDVPLKALAHSAATAAKGLSGIGLLIIAKNVLEVLRS